MGVLVVMAASVTLLPALLGFVGRGRMARPQSGGRGAERWSRAVQRHPWLAAIAATAVLLALAVRRSACASASSTQATTTPADHPRGLRPGHAGVRAGRQRPAPARREPRPPGDRNAVSALASRLRREPGVASVDRARISPAGDAAMLTLVPAGLPQAPGTRGSSIACATMSCPPR